VAAVAVPWLCLSCAVASCGWAVAVPKGTRMYIPLFLSVCCVLMFVCSRQLRCFLETYVGGAELCEMGKSAIGSRALVGRRSGSVHTGGLLFVARSTYALGVCIGGCLFTI